MKNGDDNDIDEIISRTLSGNATKEEKKRLKHWLQSSPENASSFSVLEKIWKERSSAPVNSSTQKFADDIWKKANQ